MRSRKANHLGLVYRAFSRQNLDEIGPCKGASTGSSRDHRTQEGGGSGESWRFNLGKLTLHPSESWID